MANCTECNDSGLRPFIKEGRVIPHAFVDCDCKEPIRGEAQRLSPEDFDFPISFNSLRSLCYEHGWRDPGSNIAVEEQSPDLASVEERVGDLEAISASPGSIPRRFHDDIQQIKSAVLYLQRQRPPQKLPQKPKEEASGRSDITDKLFFQT